MNNKINFILSSNATSITQFSDETAVCHNEVSYPTV